MESSQSDRKISSWKKRRWILILLVVVLAGLVRFWAAWQLPPDADEPVYLKAGKAYADLIQAGNWQGVINYEGNREHPALVKLVYAIPYLIYEPIFGQMPEMYFNRAVSVIFGVLAVLVLSLMDPLAGAFLALDSMVIKYTSEVYLEAIPLFLALCAVFSLKRWLDQGEKPAWFWLSAVSIGAAGAGKYLYLLIGIPLLVMLVQRKHTDWRRIGLFLLAAGLAFWAANPSLWNDPLNRLWRSLTFHAGYSGGGDVLRASYPWYQAVNWITAPVPWHAQVFFFPTTDVVIFILIFFGLLREARWRLWALVWMGSAFLALLLWPTKWPQYTLVLIPAMCLVASTGIKVLWDKFTEFDSTWHWSEVILPRPGKIFWVALGIFLAALLTGKLWHEFDLAQARQGWTQVKAEFTPLPSNTVNDLQVAADGRIVIATDQGVAVWLPDERSPWGASEEYIHPLNSGLANPNVRCLLMDRSGRWWFGTQAGLSVRLPDGTWQTFLSDDLEIPSDEILALEEDHQGRIWLGSKQGAAMLEPGQKWRSLVAKSPSLNGTIFDIATQIQPDQQSLTWFATQNGVTVYNSNLDRWQSYDLSQYGLGWMGISDLLVDQKGVLWVATLGDGVSKNDGERWITFRSSNSNIPGNSVAHTFQTERGYYWFGMAYSTEPGGFLTRFDGEQWQVFSAGNSGYSGGEPSAMTVDQYKRLWIGTRMDGISIFESK